MANQHFFKPLLPGFHSHLTIPVAFFLKNVQGRNEQKTAELRSDASKIIWKVKIDGQRLTNVWKEFALAHALRTGDILVFKQERDMSFHVIILGPSCCQIQYVSSLDNQNNLSELCSYASLTYILKRCAHIVEYESGRFKGKKKKAESSLDQSCFVANVTSPNLRYDSLNLPMSILMWRDFVNFKLIQRGGTLGLRISPGEIEEEDCLSEGNVVKSRSQKSANMEEPGTEKKTSSSMILDCSLLPDFVSKLHLSSSPSAKLATKDLTFSTKTDWSCLPEELLLTISTLLNNCFDGIHTRSVCTSWRSAFPFPSSLLRPSYSLPKLPEFTLESKDSCTLEKVPLFLFRVVKARDAANTMSPSAYVMGGIGPDEDEHIELRPYPLHCSVKVKIPGSDPILVYMLDCQILSLGHQYRMIGWKPKESFTTNYRGLAFLPLNKERGGGEYVVILNYCRVLLLLRSPDMRWMWLQNISDAPCRDLVTFRGRFYASFFNGDVVIIDPYSLEVIYPLMPSQPMNSSNFLVPSGDDELYLVENSIPTSSDEVDINDFICRVSKLDEEACKWVVVSDLGDRVLFIGHFGNVCCSAKELPDGYGVNGNSILFTNEGGFVMYAYKYGLLTGRAEDDLCFWRLSTENRVAIINRSPALCLWSGC